MLTLLKIDNFITVDSVELAFEPGFTVFTGETGAGKSLLLEALGLALGERAEPGKQVRPGADAAEVAALFDISESPMIQRWLADAGMDGADARRCLLRRVVSTRSASRAWINGHLCLAQDLRGLGQQLVDICGQHAHQSLLRRETHATLLDAWAGQLEQAERVRATAGRWRAMQRELAAQETANVDRRARQDMLVYQVEELDELAPRDGEFAELEQRERALSSVQSAREAVQRASTLCDGDSGASALLNDGIGQLRDVADRHPALDNALQMLRETAVTLGEAMREITAYAERLDEDPESLAAAQARLERLYRSAQKHRVEADALPALHRQLRADLDAADLDAAETEQLARKVADAEAEHQQAGQRLSAGRRACAEPWSQTVNALLAELAMPYFRVRAEMTPREGPPSSQGDERVEFLVETADHAPQALAQVASGGELSRIGLAIRVASDSGQGATGALSMVFDEVDSGVGGASAAKIGALLRELSQRRQVFCVTHLAQIASQSACHFQVTVDDASGERRTTVRALAPDERAEELARMLAGAEITDPARAHAKDLLGQRA